VSYLNSEQESYLESLCKIPMTERCFCGWFSRGECSGCDPALSCADKCLPCMAVGKRWVEAVWSICPDCRGTGRNRATDESGQPRSQSLRFPEPQLSESAAIQHE
jgi:hypothetical protein